MAGPDMRYFFVIGAPRSGTTMLQMALNRHSRIVIPPETAFFALVDRSYRGQLLRWSRIQADLQIGISPPKRRVRPGQSARDEFRRLASAYAARFAPHNVSHFGEKSPTHARRVAAIVKTFPEAKFILMYRDGRDVALSLSKVPWFPRDIFLSFALWLHYCRLHQRVVRAYRERILCVRYEDLVSDPARELRTVLQFLGLNFEDGVASGSGNCDGIPQFEYGWKGRAIEPIHCERIGVWRRELSQTQIAGLESWGKETLQRLGYELSTKPRARFYLSRLPWIFVRGVAWLLGRSIAQKSDEWLGTRLHRFNRIFDRPDSPKPIMREAEHGSSR